MTTPTQDRILLEQFDTWMHDRLFASPPQSVTHYDAFCAGRLAHPDAIGVAGGEVGEDAKKWEGIALRLNSAADFFYKTVWSVLDAAERAHDDGVGGQFRLVSSRALARCIGAAKQMNAQIIFPEPWPDAEVELLLKSIPSAAPKSGDMAQGICAKCRLQKSITCMECIPAASTGAGQISDSLGVAVPAEVSQAQPEPEKRAHVIRMAREAGFKTGPYGIGVPQAHRPDRDVDAPWMWSAMEHFAGIVIADFLDRTGQYVTNDASREAAIKDAVEAEREACAVAAETARIQTFMTDAYVRQVKCARETIAAAIRARSQT